MWTRQGGSEATPDYRKFIELLDVNVLTDSEVSELLAALGTQLLLSHETLIRELISFIPKYS